MKIYVHIFWVSVGAGRAPNQTRASLRIQCPARAPPCRRSGESSGVQRDHIYVCVSVCIYLCAYLWMCTHIYMNLCIFFIYVSMCVCRLCKCTLCILNNDRSESSRTLQRPPSVRVRVAAAPGRGRRRPRGCGGDGRRVLSDLRLSRRLLTHEGRRESGGDNATSGRLSAPRQGLCRERKRAVLRSTISALL